MNVHFNNLFIYKMLYKEIHNFSKTVFTLTWTVKIIFDQAKWRIIFFFVLKAEFKNVMAFSFLPNNVHFILKKCNFVFVS